MSATGKVMEQETKTEEIVVELADLQETPLQKMQVFAIFCVLLNEGLCNSMLLPFVGLYVAHLRDVTPDQAGYFSGVLVGTFMLGQVISARWWGRISDEYGRRLPMISGLFLGSLAMLGFGLSPNVWVCIFFRFIHGLFNGNILVAKTMMSDITDRTNISRGFSYIGVTFTVGFCAGSVVGGALYDPSTKWPAFFKDGLFAKFPALLPSFFIMLYGMFGVAATTFFAKESNTHAKPLPNFVKYLTPCLLLNSEPFEPHPNPSLEAANKAGAVLRVSMYGSGGSEGGEDRLDNSMVIDRRGRRSLNGEESRRFDGSSCYSLREDYLVNTAYAHPLDEYNSMVDELESDPPSPHRPQPPQKQNSQLKETFLAEVDECGRRKSAVDDDDEDDGEKDITQTLSAPGEVVIADQSESDKAVRYGYREAFKDPVQRAIFTQYLLLASADMVVEECFPLLAIASVQLHGLELKSGNISILMMINSLPCFIANYCFTPLSKRFQNQMILFRIGAGGSAIAIFLMTLPPLLLNKPYSIIFTMIAMCTSTFFYVFSFTMNSILTAKAAPPGRVGMTMGIMQSCGSIARTVTPFIISPLFALTLSGDYIYPFNFAFVFMVAVVFQVIICYRSYALRTTSEGKLELTSASS